MILKNVEKNNILLFPKSRQIKEAACCALCPSKTGKECPYIDTVEKIIDKLLELDESC